MLSAPAKSNNVVMVIGHAAATNRYRSSIE